MCTPRVKTLERSSGPGHRLIGRVTKSPEDPRTLLGASRLPIETHSIRNVGREIDRERGWVLKRTPWNGPTSLPYQGPDSFSSTVRDDLNPGRRGSCLCTIYFDCGEWGVRIVTSLYDPSSPLSSPLGQVQGLTIDCREEGGDGSRVSGVGGGGRRSLSVWVQAIGLRTDSS